jgi:TonB family protein
MSLINLLALWLMLGADTVVGPLYPPNVVSGGTVIAELVSGAGGVSDIKILSGEEPFVSSSRAALQSWNLHPGKAGGDLVIVHFRQPNLYYMGDAQEEIRCAGADPSMPCPKYVTGPAYPAQAVGQGSVILKVEVAADGSILSVRTIQAMGALTDVSVTAVRKWKFTPAENARGLKEASHAYAVFVYRFPLINKEK